MVRPILLFTVSLVIALAATAGRAGQDKDPVYDGKKGSEWVDVLINDKSARKRALSVEALSKLWAEKRYEESLPNISRSMRLDSSAAVRAQAVIALGALKEDDFKYVGKDMIDALGMEKDSRVRKEIATVMSRYPPLAKAGVANLTAALKDSEAATRIAVAEALGQAGSDAKSAAVNLAPMLGEEDKSVRLAAVIALGRTAPEGAPAIAETMARMLTNEKDLDIRIELVSSLGLLGEKSVVVVTALARLLTDKEDELRRRAARTLGTFGVAAAPAADALLAAASAEKLKDIRVDIVRAFGSSLGQNLKTRVKDVLPLLKDTEYEVRLAIVEEIGALGNELREDTETLKVLRSRLSDPHVKVREAVASAIRKIEKKPEPKDPKKDAEPKKSP
jgi:HEAT repeat protein